MNADEASARADRRLRAVGIATVALFLLTILLILAVGVFALLTRRALCTFEGDLTTRRDANNAILNAPDNRGRKVIYVYGLRVPRDVVQNQVQGQNRTLDSLRGLRCR